MFFPDFDGSEVMLEYGVDKEGNGAATIFVDDKAVNGITSSGYRIVDGVFYDPQGNIIDEIEYAIEYESIGENLVRAGSS